MLLLAVDPGVRQSGAVVAERGDAGRLAVRWAGLVPSRLSALSSLATTVRLDVVAIEWAEGSAYQPYRVPGLLASQGVAGTLRGIVWARLGREAVLVTARTWRAELVGRLPRGASMDAVMRDALRPHVSGQLPCNVHLLDALGVAVWAARRLENGCYSPKRTGEEANR